MGVRIGFLPFSFDREERILRRDGRTVPLPPKVAEALALLLAQPGALVEKNALRDALWPDGFIEDGNLTQTIYLIRRALDPDGDGRAFVETVPRRGYRFVARVSVDDASAAPRSVSAARGAASRTVFALRTVAAAAIIAFAFGGVSVGGVSRVPTPLGAEAAREYTLGRYTWDRRTAAGMRASLVHFGRVVTLAPNDPRGYAGLAITYEEIGDWEFTAIAPKRDAYLRAEDYARQALRHDSHSGEALGALGGVAMQRDNDLDRAEAMLRASLAYRPDDARAHELLGIDRLYRGDAESARRMLQRATQLDPLSRMNLVWYGKSLYYARRHAEAHVVLAQLSELDVIDFGAVEIIAMNDIELGRSGEARAAVARLKVPAHKRDYKQMLSALVDVRAGVTPRDLPNLRPNAAHPAHVDTATASALCLALGRRDDALAWLELGMRDKSTRMTRRMLALDPRLAALRDDARFRALTG
ncbi:MAG TPA: tetratricopeptide repeat protein [Candidatus Elarobacter sp.]|jgi:DNA-binding winged helix-turn-helix (wHTH) protein/Flp pilus assembly protein TadD